MLSAWTGVGKRVTKDSRGLQKNSDPTSLSEVACGIIGVWGLSFSESGEFRTRFEPFIALSSLDKQMLQEVAEGNF